MKKLHSIFICLLLLCVPSQFAFSQDNETQETREILIPALFAGTETLLSNGVIVLYNVIYAAMISHASWTVPRINNIRQNFTEPWQWEETDGFKVNQIGHPYHASFYFNAGRVNGFNFYESALFSVLGSATWETICESNRASINDFLTGTISSMPVGEIFYRLYLEACYAGLPAPIAALINPMAGIHRYFFNWRPPNYGGNLYRLMYQIGTGYSNTVYNISPNNNELYNSAGAIFNFGFSTVYGNPFEQNSSVPFDHFEFSVFLGFRIYQYLNIRVISDGYLFSFAPVHTAANTISTGLSLHFDLVSLGKYDMFEGTIDYYSTALDWTIKYQRLFSDDFSFQAKFHAGATPFGASNYYSNVYDREIRNFGAGLNGKLYLSLDHKKLGRLDADVFGFVLWSYPGINELSKGTAYWLFADLSYTYFITERLSVSVADSFAMERGTFSDFPKTAKFNNEIKLILGWNL